CFVLIPYLSTRLTCLLFCSWYADSRDLHSSLHDALPISQDRRTIACGAAEHSQWSTFAESSTRFDQRAGGLTLRADNLAPATRRSEEHTSELQSRGHLVCRLLLEKKKKKYKTT